MSSTFELSIRRIYTWKEIILAVLFIVLPIIDMVNGILVVGGYISEAGLASPSQLGRIAAIILFLIICYHLCLDIKWLVIFSYPLTLELVSGIYHGNSYAVFYGVLTSYKIFYIGLLCIVLTYCLQTSKDVYLLGFFLKMNLLIISLSIIFGLVTGLGNSTYGHGFGTKGFFSSGNGLGVYLGVMGIVLISLRRYGFYSNVSNVTLSLICISTAFIGTKTAMLFSLLTVVLLVSESRYRLPIFIGGTTICITAFSTFYGLFASVFDVVLLRYNNSEGLFEFIASGRSGYVVEAIRTLSDQAFATLRMLCGSGSFLSFQNPNSLKAFDTLETDLFDVLFMYGVVGVGIYLALLVKILSGFLSYPLLLMATILLIAHSMVAGHVLFNGMSGFIIAILFSVSTFVKEASRAE